VYNDCNYTGEQGEFVDVNSHTEASLIYSDLMRPWTIG